jgi:hypothetical protein
VLGTIDNDAASFYDRITCNLAMLISTYYGVPDKYCEIQANNLHKAIFCTRMALGESKISCNHTSTTPIYGTGQGSCASLAIWLLISSFTMSILQQLENGMIMEDFSETNTLIAVDQEF